LNVEENLEIKERVKEIFAGAEYRVSLNFNALCRKFRKYSRINVERGRSETKTSRRRRESLRDAVPGFILTLEDDLNSPTRKLQPNSSRDFQISSEQLSLRETLHRQFEFPSSISIFYV